MLQFWTGYGYPTNNFVFGFYLPVFELVGYHSNFQGVQFANNFRMIPRSVNQLVSFQKDKFMITDKEIEEAKKRTKYTLDSQHHEHNDCIRIAYEWIDAQKKIKNKSNKATALKHVIEKWGGRYISTSDVCVAAELNPDVHGVYPYFNISSRLTEPSIKRLNGIEEAMKHSNYRDSYNPKVYKINEEQS